MGNLLEPGGGVPGAGALLAEMWRGVYQKAAAVAEAGARALLAEHVYRQHGRRAVSVVLDGGGLPLTAGTRCDLELPWAYVVEGWALYAGGPPFDPVLPPETWSLVLDLLVAGDFAAFPDFVSITGGAPPALDLAGAFPDKARAESVQLDGWAVALPRGRVLRVAVVSAETVSLATLTLFLRAA